MKIRNFLWCTAHEQDCPHYYCFFCNFWYCKLYYPLECPSCGRKVKKRRFKKTYSEFTKVEKK